MGASAAYCAPLSTAAALASPPIGRLPALLSLRLTPMLPLATLTSDGVALTSRFASSCCCKAKPSKRSSTSRLTWPGREQMRERCGSERCELGVAISEGMLPPPAMESDGEEAERESRDESEKSDAPLGGEISFLADDESRCLLALTRV